MNPNIIDASTLRSCDTCTMGRLLAGLPYNRAADPHSPAEILAALEARGSEHAGAVNTS